MALTGLGLCSNVMRSVVVAKLRNKQFFRANLVHEPVFVGDSSGPIPREGVFKWFWFTNAFKWRALNILYELVDALEDFPVSALPK